MTVAVARAFRARGERSARVPMGVATTSRVPLMVGRRLATLLPAQKAADRGDELLGLVRRQDHVPAQPGAAAQGDGGLPDVEAVQPDLVQAEEGKAVVDALDLGQGD